MIKFRENRVILLGDTHSYQRTLAVIKNKLVEQNCDIIFLGDGGEGFHYPETDLKSLSAINQICEGRGINLYYIRGNHTNPRVFNSGYSFSNLFLVQDYTKAEFPNREKALLVGGGVSIDRRFRVSGIDYWPEEVTPYYKTGESFNYLFSHDCPDYFNHSTESLWVSPFSAFLKIDKDLYRDALNQRITMNKIVDDIGTKFIWSGHYHNKISEKKKNIKYRCVDVEEFLSIKIEG